MVAFYGLITQFESAFSVVAVQFLEEDRQREMMGSSTQDAETKKGWILVAQGNESAFMASTDSGTLKKHVASLLDTSTGGTIALLIDNVLIKLAMRWDISQVLFLI